MPGMRSLFSLSYPVLNYLTTIKLMVWRLRPALAEHKAGQDYVEGMNGGFESWGDGPGG
jgi:hypothetical protein